MVTKKELFHDYFNFKRVYKKKIDVLLKEDLDKVKSSDILRSVVSEFIVRWPRWKVIFAKKDLNWAVSEYLEEFEVYLSEIVKIAINYIKVIEDKRVVKESKEIACQTESVTPDYHIELQGPMKHLFKTLFTVEGDDIVAMQHLGKPWNGSIEFPKFINNPYVYIWINLPSISFARTVVPEVERFLTGEKQSPSHRPVNMNVNWTKVNNNKECCAYSYESMMNFVDDFLKVTENKEHSKEIGLMMKEAFLDVKEYLEHFLTNSKAVIPLTNNTYVRSKRHADAHNFLNYYEVISPKIELTVYNFNTDAETLLKTANAYLSAAVTFRCTFCSKGFSHMRLMQTHYQNAHLAEEIVLCNKCAIMLPIEDLVKNRWKHRCN
ncbi:PREDICTED: uncharacterized protein LOC108561061 [Nicrophorus vespilloides]|uniref:Uncharacterized protein LOC108561061 n=1 Tax=Nicrophorus vespilloides TaxID=110193 RepID=A0ABM1MIB8_NICVS|nr:PREDICTED: uncharacterized protein LOC108561061 [Nicrophorus vespilloides]